MAPDGYGYGKKTTVMVTEHKTRKKDRKGHLDTDSTLDIGNGFWSNG